MDASACVRNVDARWRYGARRSEKWEEERVKVGGFEMKSELEGGRAGARRQELADPSERDGPIVDRRAKQAGRRRQLKARSRRASEL